MLLVGLLTDNILSFDLKKPIAFIHLLLVDDIDGIASCGSLRDLGLPDLAIHVALPPLNVDLAPANHAEALNLLEEYANLLF